MKDAISGALTLQIILIFMIIINCYLAFSVNYTKAFRIKNEIRNIIEKNEGLTCSAVDQINDLMLKVNYGVQSGERNCPEGYETAALNNGLFCYKYQKVDVTGTSNQGSTYKGAYYTVLTFVDVDIPIFNKIFPEIALLNETFTSKGETALIYSSGEIGSGLPDNCSKSSTASE